MKLIAFISLLITAHSAFAADSIKPIGKNVLSCTEIVTGSEVKVKVETVYTQFKFNDIGESNDVTSRTITIQFDDKTAVSRTDAPSVKPDVSWAELGKIAFLNDNYIGADGTEYITDILKKDGKQYPATLMRLKATIPVAQRKTEMGLTMSHFYINLRSEEHTSELQSH